MGATVLKHIEFLDLSDGKILVIFVSTSGVVQRKLIRVGERYTQDELDKAGRYLCDKFSGKTSDGNPQRSAAHDAVRALAVRSHAVSAADLGRNPEKSQLR